MGILDASRGNKGENLEKLENRDLLSAIDALAHRDSAETRDRVYRTLLNVILLIPVAEIPAGFVPGENVTDTRTPLRFPLIRDARGNKVVPIFSDLEALRNWDPNALYVGLKSIDIFKIVMATDADEIRINPFDPARKMIRLGGTLTRREFQLLSEGRVPAGVAGNAIKFDLKPGQKFANRNSGQTTATRIVGPDRINREEERKCGCRLLSSDRLASESGMGAANANWDSARRALRSGSN